MSKYISTVHTVSTHTQLDAFRVAPLQADELLEIVTEAMVHWHRDPATLSL